MGSGTEAQDRRRTDGQLLAQFVNHHDNEAFAELVARYADLVLGLCRRTLNDEHSAEDAFQATFLVLARKAPRIRNHTSLASWLYAVAYRTALRARTKQHNRREQALLEEMTDTDNLLAHITNRYEQQLLDEELQQLAAKYREPLVLRYLMGKSNKHVAAKLGLTLGVVEGRLKRGKDQLRQRLSRRGIGVTIILATTAASAGTAHATESLMAATVQAAAALHAGVPLPSNHSQNAVRLSKQEFAMKTSTFAATSTIAAVAIIMAGLALAQDGTLGQAGTQTEGNAVNVSSATIPLENAAPTFALAEGLKTVSGPDKSATTAEERIEEALHEPSDFDFAEMSLQKVADTIAKKHGINVMIDARALGDVGLASDLPITLRLADVSLLSGLNFMLHQMDLTWTIHDEVLLITTPEEAENMLITKVYDVADLVLCKDKAGEEWADYDTLIELITSTIEPDSWDEVGGAGAIEVAPFAGAKMLVLAQTCQVHWQVEQLFDKLRAITEKQTSGPPVREKMGPGGMNVGGMGGMGMGMGVGMGVGMGGMGMGMGSSQHASKPGTTNAVEPPKASKADAGNAPPAKKQ